MAKEYHYIVKYTEEDGWTIDVPSEEAHFPDGTIWDTEAGEWQLPYLGDGKFNGKEEDLAETLSDILSLHNQMQGRSLL
jgi:hypothetical protein